MLSTQANIGGTNAGTGFASGALNEQTIPAMAAFLESHGVKRYLNDNPETQNPEFNDLMKTGSTLLGAGAAAAMGGNKADVNAGANTALNATTYNELLHAQPIKNITKPNPNMVTGGYVEKRYDDGTICNTNGGGQCIDLNNRPDNPGADWAREQVNIGGWKGVAAIPITLANTPAYSINGLGYIYQMATGKPLDDLLTLVSLPSAFQPTNNYQTFGFVGGNTLGTAAFTFGTELLVDAAALPTASSVTLANGTNANAILKGPTASGALPNGANGEIQALSSNARIGLREELAGQASIPRTLDKVWGSTADDLAQTFKLDGAQITAKAPLPGTSGKAEAFVVDGHPLISEYQYHPGGGAHGDGAYYKFVYKNGLEVRVIDPNSGFKPGTIANNQQYFDKAGNRITYIAGKWVSYK